MAMFATMRSPLLPLIVFGLTHLLAAWLPPFVLICISYRWRPPRRLVIWSAGFVLVTLGTLLLELLAHQGFEEFHASTYGGTYSEPLWHWPYWEKLLPSLSATLFLSAVITTLYGIFNRSQRPAVPPEEAALGGLRLTQQQTTSIERGTTDADPAFRA